jgi:hypothetical protein
MQYECFATGIISAPVVSSLNEDCSCWVLGKDCVQEKRSPLMGTVTQDSVFGGKDILERLTIQRNNKTAKENQSTSFQ